MANNDDKWERVPAIQKRITGYAWQSAADPEGFIDLAFAHLYELPDDFFAANTDSYLAQKCCFAARAALFSRRRSAQRAGVHLVPLSDLENAAQPPAESAYETSLLDDEALARIEVIAARLTETDAHILRALWQTVAQEDASMFTKRSGRIHQGKLARQLGVHRGTVNRALRKFALLLAGAHENV